VADDPISPELALVDPALARRPAQKRIPMIETTTNGASPAENVPPLETLLYEAGLITPDQLGELVRDSVVLRRPVATVALERGLVTPEAMQVLLAQARAAVMPVEGTNRASEASVADPTPASVERVDDRAAETWGHVSHEPPPAAAVSEMPAVTPPAIPAYALMLRLQNGERLIVDTAVTLESAAELGRTLAVRFAAGGEWPLVAGRFIRPEAVVSVDIERSLEA
jgi:hypothetical protein